MAATKVESLTNPRDSLPNSYTSVTAREVDFVTRFNDNWDALRNIMGIMRPIRKAPGTSLISYTADVTLEDGDVDPGCVIPYSKASITQVAKADVEIRKYAKAVPIEDVDKYGAAIAVEKSDDAFLTKLQNMARLEASLARGLTPENVKLAREYGYTEALTEHIIAHSGDSPVIQAQMENPEKDILTGLPFREESGTLTEAQMADLFRERVAAMNTQEKAQTYIKIQSTPTHVQLEEMITAQMEGVNREQMQNALVEAMQQQMSMSADELMGYVEAMEDTELVELYRNLVEQQIRLSMAAQAQQQLTGVEPEQLAQLLDGSVDSYTQEQCAQYYEEVLSFSQSTYEENLTKLGYVELDDPSGIHLYASSFENKDVIEEAIARYNSGVDELKQIHYTDYVGLIMQSVTTIIDAITYVLVAFVSISLVVSSIMIGVITLISVQERTREIGILRAIGASKRNVSSMFNAETVIIGFISGVLGVGVTCLLCIPINVLIGKLTNIAGLRVYLPWQVGAILIAISVGLTLLAGIIPSRSAARKDPVVALRTE